MHFLGRASAYYADGLNQENLVKDYEVLIVKK